MGPELLARIKDVMALSGVSERTAKTRLAGLKGIGRHRSLALYCSRYKLRTKDALVYVRSKRFDALHCNRIKRGALPPSAYEIRTWEEVYVQGDRVQKLIFQEYLFFEAGQVLPSCRLHFCSLPRAFIEYGKDLELPVLEAFLAQALPTARPPTGRAGKETLLKMYGLMVLKRSAQERICFVLKFESKAVVLGDAARALRREFGNSKKIWFCAQDLLPPSEKQALGFRDIEGTGFAMAGVPGDDRKGKVVVRVER